MAYSRKVKSLQRVPLGRLGVSSSTDGGVRRHEQDFVIKPIEHLLLHGDRRFDESGIRPKAGLPVKDVPDHERVDYAFESLPTGGIGENDRQLLPLYVESPLLESQS